MREYYEMFPEDIVNVNRFFLQYASEHQAFPGTVILRCASGVSMLVVLHMTMQ